jgi:hypothetical protein
MMCDHLAEEALITEDENEDGAEEGGHRPNLDHTIAAQYRSPVFEGTESSSGGSEARSYTLKTVVPWGLIGRCCFSLCGSLIHNAGAWNLVDLYIMCVEIIDSSWVRFYERLIPPGRTGGVTVQLME